MLWVFIVLATISGIALLGAAGYGIYQTFRPVRILQEDAPPTPLPSPAPVEPEVAHNRTETYQDGSWTVTTTTTYTTTDPNADPTAVPSATLPGGGPLGASTSAFLNLSRTLETLFREAPDASAIRAPRAPR